MIESTDKAKMYAKKQNLYCKPCGVEKQMGGSHQPTPKRRLLHVHGIINAGVKELQLLRFQWR